MPVLTGPFLSCTGDLRARCNTPGGVSAEQRRGTESLHTRIWLTFWAVSTCCWLMSNFSSTSPPAPSPQGCPQSFQPPVCIDSEDCPGWPCTWPCWALSFPWAHSSRPSRSLWMAYYPLWVTSCTTQFGVTRRLAEGLLNLNLCCWRKYWTLLVPVQTLEGHSLLLVSTWTLSRVLSFMGCSHPANSLSIKYICLQ